MSLKYLSNFWRTLEMPFVNCKINFILIWLANCVISKGNTNFCKNRYKIYVPVVNLSTQDNTKLLQQLKSGFKHTINWNQK